MKQEAIDVLNRLRSNLSIIIENKEKAIPGTYMLVTEDYQFCIVENGAGINQTNIAIFMLRPFVFCSKVSAIWNNDRIHAHNNHGPLTFIPIEAPDYWSHLEVAQKELIDFIIHNS